LAKEIVSETEMNILMDRSHQVY